MGLPFPAGEARHREEIAHAETKRQLDRANRIIGWMMPYIGSMCPPQNGLGDLNDHCCENRIRSRMDDETKGPSIRQHAAGARPSGVMPFTSEATRGEVMARITQAEVIARLLSNSHPPSLTAMRRAQQIINSLEFHGYVIAPGESRTEARHNG